MVFFIFIQLLIEYSVSSSGDPDLGSALFAYVPQKKDARLVWVNIVCLCPTKKDTRLTWVKIDSETRILGCRSCLDPSKLTNCVPL